jgi:hypothetical protein
LSNRHHRTFTNAAIIMATLVPSLPSRSFAPVGN